HAHAIGVLELLHERIEVKRVRLEILLEAGLLGDPLDLHVELVGEVGADQLEYGLAGGAHPASRRLASRADTGARLSGPACSSARWVWPTTSSRAPCWARMIACAKPARVKRPCGTTPRRRRPSRQAPPFASGSLSSRNP